jgi:hypothetical protein
MTSTLGRPRSENIVQPDFPVDGLVEDHVFITFPCGCTLHQREVDNEEGWAYALDLCYVHRTGGARP